MKEVAPSMEEPAIIVLPLSSYENMAMELAWRDNYMTELIEGIYQDLNGIKTKLDNDDFPISPNPFDPLRTFGKYE